MFGGMFGGGYGQNTRRRNGPMKGRDVQKAVTVTFEEAAFGVKKQIKLNKYVECSTCHGRRCGSGNIKENLSSLQWKRSGIYYAENTSRPVSKRFYVPALRRHG